MEWKLKEVILREPTLLVMVVGVPNVGKSALINTIHQIASSHFPGKMLLHFFHYGHLQGRVWITKYAISMEMDF